MNEDEALDKALEALENCTTWHLTREQFDKNVTAINAIKQSRSAPVQEPVAWEYTTSYVPNPDRDNGVRVTSELRVAQVNALPGSIKPLGYTTPPAAQRQWVGLTDEEVMNCYLFWVVDLQDIIGFYKGIETKLREKNA